jgi:Flp pilus assembly pilin Flp
LIAALERRRVLASRRIRACRTTIKGVRSPRAGVRRVTMGRMLRGFMADETGQDIIEYALLTSFLALVSIAGLKLLGAKIEKNFTPLIQAF